MKLAGFERISRVMLVLEGVFESEEVKYGSVKEIWVTF